MSLYVLSWNMQGWSNGTKADALNDVVNPIINAGNQCVVLLQECGTPKSCRLHDNTEVPWNNNLFCVNYRVDPTAQIQRCSTATIVSRNMLNMEVPIGDFETIDANRVILCFRWNNKLFATIHAPANGDDSVMYVKIAINIVRDLAVKESISWILMGDFNSDPNSYNLSMINLLPNTLNHIRYDGSSDRTAECYMIYSGMNTQGAHGNRVNRYDYAFMDDHPLINNLGYFSNNLQNVPGFPMVINVPVSVQGGNILSDHNLIGLNFA